MIQSLLWTQILPLLLIYVQVPAVRLQLPLFAPLQPSLHSAHVGLADPPAPTDIQ